MAGLKVITPPATEPVTLDEIKDQLRIDLDDSDYDTTLTPLISAAREWCEGYQNRAYVTQTLELALDCWPYASEIELPRPPLQSVISIIYTDNDGASETLDETNYIVDDYSFVARLVKGQSISWPSVSLQAVNGIKIRYVAGYESADNVLQRIKQAITLLVTHWYENGMCDPPPAVYALLRLDRVMPI